MAVRLRTERKKHTRFIDLNHGKNRLKEGSNVYGVLVIVYELVST